MFKRSYFVTLYNNDDNCIVYLIHDNYFNVVKFAKSKNYYRYEIVKAVK